MIKIKCDSRLVVPGDTFVAIRGARDDGAKYIAEAVARGATTIVCDKQLSIVNCQLSIVNDARAELARLACEAYGNPSHKLRVFGVTGTNGKTTVAYLLRQILNDTGNPCGLVSTIGHCASGNVRAPLTDTNNTTPGPLELQELFARMLENGCDSCVMEVSSHAIEQKRAGGVKFAAVAFTNLTRDHLDYHKTMEAYFEVKKSLFLHGFPCAINIDDPYGKKIAESSNGILPLSTAGSRCYFLSYGKSPDALVRYENEVLTPDGSAFTLTFPGGRERMRLRLLGRHNIGNALAAFSLALLAGVNPHKALISLMGAKPVRGRLERVKLKDSPAAFFVDYAHTPDALENVLGTLREITAARLIVVFGAGGDRDRGKRPLMGEVCARLADVAIVTSDNPRSEEPEAIIGEILAGMTAHVDVRPPYVEPDRRTAIRRAVMLATNPGDVVLIAGKGHETTQVYAGHTEHFDDREELVKFAG